MTTASGSECTPTETSLTPTAAAATVAVKITATSAYTVIGYSGFGRGWWVLLVSTLGAGLYLARRRVRLPAALALLFVAVFACGATGRGAPAANSDPTLPGSYTYTLTATDGKITRTATYTLTVTSD